MDIKPKAGSRIHSIVAKTSENRGLEEIKDGKTLRLFGGIGSPYSNKMLMYLRFRRLPHRWVCGQERACAMHVGIHITRL